MPLREIFFILNFSAILRLFFDGPVIRKGGNWSTDSETSTYPQVTITPSPGVFLFCFSNFYTKPERRNT